MNQYLISDRNIPSFSCFSHRLNSEDSGFDRYLKVDSPISKDPLTSSCNLINAADLERFPCLHFYNGYFRQQS